MTPSLVCETARLRLRRVTPDDAAFVLRHLNEAPWIRHIGDRGVRTLDDARRYIETRFLEPYRTLGFGLWLVELKDAREPIGLCGFVQRADLPCPDLGFSLVEAHWGHGYALEAAQAALRHADEVLKLPRVLAITARANERSGHLLRKVGFALLAQTYVSSSGEELLLYERA